MPRNPRLLFDDRIRQNDFSRITCSKPLRGYNCAHMHTINSPRCLAKSYNETRYHNVKQDITRQVYNKYTRIRFWFLQHTNDCPCLTVASYSRIKRLESYDVDLCDTATVAIAPLLLNVSFWWWGVSEPLKKHASLVRT